MASALKMRPMLIYTAEGPRSVDDRGAQLVARLDYFQYEQKGPITRARFLARALKLANHKARELGWIV
ncbi:MAG: hypothetical protein WBW37_08380 [Methyloceanibacter sp.]